MRLSVVQDQLARWRDRPPRPRPPCRARGGEGDVNSHHLSPESFCVFSSDAPLGTSSVGQSLPAPYQAPLLRPECTPNLRILVTSLHPICRSACTKATHARSVGSLNFLPPPTSPAGVRFLRFCRQAELGDTHALSLNVEKTSGSPCGGIPRKLAGKATVLRASQNKRDACRGKGVKRGAILGA